MERMGDHATNIAEDVIFAITGEDVRHGMINGKINGKINGQINSKINDLIKKDKK